MTSGEPVPDRVWQVRLLALSAFVPAVVAVALVVADVGAVSTETWRMIVWLPALAMVVQLVALVFVWIRAGCGPAAFAVSRAGGFRLRLRRAVACASSPWAVAMCVQLLHPGWDDVPTRAMALALVGMFTVPAVLALVSPIAVVLSPEGVKMFRGRVRPWDEDVVPPTALLRWVDVNLSFVSDAIAYYRAHPEFRAEIGTPAEHRRLYAALAAARVPA